jgi:cystathionine beta-lyase
MQKYSMQFDKIHNRIGTNSDKWDSLQSLYGLSPNEAIPMWVADMDFEAPEAVTNCIREMAEQGIYGYAREDDTYRQAIVSWMQRRHQWQIQPDSVLSVHGIVNAIALAIQAYTQPGDGIIIFSPVYHAFSRVIKASQRSLVESPLVKDSIGKYKMDLDATANLLTGNEKMLILCSPHNPGGRVWSVQELEQVAEFAERHNLLIVSDEIHHDLVYDGYIHTPFEKAVPSARPYLMTLTSTTKTFNIAGMHTGNVIISDEKRREKFKKTLQALAISPSSFGVAMTSAAYNGGDEWLDQLLIYLAQNYELFNRRIHQINGLISMPLESTYLCWVDYRSLNMSLSQYKQKIESQSKVAASYGDAFGSGGEGHLRFNIAMPRQLLDSALDRVQTAFESV